MKIPVPMICLLASLPAGLACGPAGGASVSALATATPPDPPSAEALLSTVRLSDLSLAPDGGAALLTSNASGRPRPVVVDLDSGEARPIVGGTGGTLRAVDWFPDGRRLLLSGDDQGDELTHLFVADTDGSVRDLTPGAQRRAIFLDWSADGLSMFISDNQRDPGYADVYRLNASDFTRELLFRDTVGLQFGAISGDGRRIALLLPSGQTGGRIFTYDVREGRLVELPGQPDDAAAVPRAFSPDGASLYVTSNEDGDFARLERVDLDDGRRDVLFAPAWDVADARLVPGGRWLFVMVNEDARLRPYLVATDGSESHAVRVEPTMSVREARVSGDGLRLAYLGSTGRTPTNLYVRHLSPPGAEPSPTDASRLLLSGLPAAVDPAMFVEPEIVRFPGLDSLPIPAILYRPHAASAERRAPVVLWAHGGPGGQAQIGFSPLIHYLVGHGYGVLEVNNRGSAGYGKRFWRLDDRRHGDADLDDYVAAKRWLGSLGWADSSRVAIAGSSYGGFLVLAALAFRPGTFDAGVDLYGISNWVRTIESMPPWFEPFRPALERELGPFDDLDAFRAKSPVFHADQIKEPLIVLQGANDPRVLQSESDEIVAVLRERGVPVRYVLFDDEGHGFVKRENRVEAYRAIREFLDEHLAAVEHPAPEVIEQFGRLVGDWDIRQWRMDSTGRFPIEPSPARWTFRHVLGGHAVQDFWIEPPPEEELADGEVRQFGTNLRMYDAERDRWNIVWTSSDDPRLNPYTATREGDDLVMVGDHEGERPSRIVFFDIWENSFRWRLELETADGWLTVSRIEGTKRR